MSTYNACREKLRSTPRTWLVTGAAGFIGSNLVEALLRIGQSVVGLDNFSTGHRRNLKNVEQQVGSAWRRFRFVEGDIRSLETCHKVCAGIDFVLHEAALGSVPRSIDSPILSHESNINGFLNVLVAARDEGVQRLVYAASSSTYGDHPELPKMEDRIGKPLSPYAVTKLVNELYAGVFERVYGIQTIGLRYFNVYGRRQDPDGSYAAVIPRWIGNLLGGRPCVVNGDGESSRDFCHVDNIVQANLLAATAESSEVTGQVFNVACGERTSLNELFRYLRDGLAEYRPGVATMQPIYQPFRIGDVRHSQADISKISSMLGYSPTYRVKAGLLEVLPWYLEQAK